MKMMQTAENQNISQCPLPNQPRPEGFFLREKPWGRGCC